MDILAKLAWTSLQGALLAFVVWGVCRLLPRLPASVRCGLWWLVCLQLLVGLAWTTPVRLPLLSAPAMEVLPVPAAAQPVILETAAPVTVSPEKPFPWPLAVAGLWLAGVSVHLVLAARQLRSARSLVRRSEPVEEPWVREAFAELLRQADLRRDPELRVSAEVTTPQVLGLLRPCVLIPELGRLSRPEISMALCHEIVHLRRGDLWLGWVPALAQRLFFFNPLAGWAAREYALAREAACDAEVLRRLGEAPQDYGRLLLRLGVAPCRASLAGASPSFHNLKRRLQMLQQASENPRRVGGWWLAALVVLTGVVPYRVVQATPADPNPAEETRKTSIRNTKASNDSYILIRGEEGRGDGVSVVMSGSTDDIDRVKRLRQGGEAVLWVRQSGKEYVIRDAATLARVEALFEPMNELGEEQSKLGDRQSALGDRQSALGDQQAKLGDRQAEVAEKLANRAQGGKPTEDLQRQLEDLGRQQSELGRKQSELGSQQAALGEEQSKLGRRQEELAREAERQLKVMLNDAIARGIAQEIR
jgi:bla regulator protein BlaR1